MLVFWRDDPFDADSQTQDGEDLRRRHSWMYGIGCFILHDAQGQTVRWGRTGEEDGMS